MIQIGKILKNKREELGLKFEQIEEELKIKKKYLQYLESNDFSKFKSTAHAKGFLRNYSKLLELNDEQTLALYRRDVENLDMERKVNLVEEEEEFELNLKERILERIKQIQLTRKKNLV